jgi:hypothetical protein
MAIFTFVLPSVALLLVAPAKVAKLSPWLGGIDPPENWWGQVLKSVKWLLNLVLSGLSRCKWVRDAWAKEYAIGKRNFEDLNEFALESFVNEPVILDAWVVARLKQVEEALATDEFFVQRKTYVNLPVQMEERIGEVRVVEEPSPTMLHNTFTRPRAVITIVGGGGIGKSTLACAIARWAMADDEKERIAQQKMVPVLIRQVTTDLRDTVIRRLTQMLGNQEMPDKLIDSLLTQQRLLVIVDALSERNKATQDHIESVFGNPKPPFFNAMIITSRVEPDIRVAQTRLRPLLLDEKQIVPFLIAYIAQRPDTEPLKDGQIYLELGRKMRELARAGSQFNPVTPLLVKLFVDSALRRASAGENLDSLPQDVPEVFLDFLKGVHPETAGEPGSLGEVEFIRAATELAKTCLGERMVSYDFSYVEAKKALDDIVELKGLPDRAPELLDALISSGIIERRIVGVESILRFALDPVAEYLAAIDAVTELRSLARKWRPVSSP